MHYTVVCKPSLRIRFVSRLHNWASMSLWMSSAGYIFQVKQPNLRMLNGLQRILSLGERKMAWNHPKQQNMHSTQSRTAGSDLNGQLWMERSCMKKEAVHVEERDSGVIWFSNRNAKTIVVILIRWASVRWKWRTYQFIHNLIIPSREQNNSAGG